MDDATRQHCAELDRCNQRGGRMLSILDLLDAGTLDLDLAAHLMAHVSRGASFLVGASPGGAGKTTVMAALLNLCPPDRPLVAATPQAVRAAARAGGRPCCCVCHEIGPGQYFAYLWGQALREYCALGRLGHMLASNLHADDLDEARDQICRQNGVPAEEFRRFELLVFLRVDGGLQPRRRVEKVYAADAAGTHRLIYEAGKGPRPDLAGAAWAGDLAYAARCRGFLAGAWARPARTIEETRRAVVRFLESERAVPPPAGAGP